MEDILDQEKQSIEANKSEHPTVTLAANFQKPEGGANMYVWFGYVPQKICNHTLGQVWVSINADPINANKQVKNQRRKYDD